MPNHYKSCYYTYTNQQYCDSSDTCTSYLRELCLEVKTLPLLNFIPGRIQELLLHHLGKFSRFIYLFIFSSLLLSRFSLNRSATVLEWNGHSSPLEWFSRQKQICLSARVARLPKKKRKYAWVKKSNVFRYMSGSATVLRLYNWTNVFGTCHEAIVGLG